MSFKLNTLKEIKDFFAEYQPGMVVCFSGPGGSIHASGHIPWDFENFHYSLVKNLPSIDWSQVSEKYRWLAVDEDGEAFLYSQEPSIDTDGWYGAGCIAEADVFVSYVPGTVDWKDSLVKREQVTGNRPHLFIFDDVL